MILCVRRGTGRVAVDPIGVALLITAGKRSAPADRLTTPFRPHGGRTSFRRRAGAWKRGTGPWRVTASRCPRVCLRHTRGNAKLDPYGVPLQGGSCPRVRLWLTRGYQKFDPYGVDSLAVWLWGALGSPCGRPRCIFAGVGPLWGPHIYASSFHWRATLTRGYRVVRPLCERLPRGVVFGGGGHRSAGEALCAIWQTVKADARVAPPFSVESAARWGCCGDPSHGFLFPSHGSAVPSLGFSHPRLVFMRKLGSICAI